MKCDFASITLANASATRSRPSSSAIATVGGRVEGVVAADGARVAADAVVVAAGTWSAPLAAAPAFATAR